MTFARNDLRSSPTLERFIDGLTRALADAALRPYVASRIVQIIDPIEDAELFERSGLPGPQNLFEPARAYVHQGRGSYAETADPVRLPALMTRTERGG